MSPTSKSKSKSKEKPIAKAAKEQLKASKLLGSTTTGNVSLASAYSPVSGTFHSVETALVSSSSPLNSNGRICNIDEAAEHSGSSQATQYDSLSNNGSCSGESEDHKEKIASMSPWQETIPGSENEKREKIRQKNEKKHQRQRERRAQELHDRCSGYLMSKKLEALSEQLVAMGFTSERATMALMLNEGKVEESVNWLFEASEKEAQKMHKANISNLKIDISEELAHIAALEAMYKCSKQEVERAVIACEGDLDKVKEKLEPPVSPSKPVKKPELMHTMRLQEMPISTITTQLGRNEFELKSRNHQLSLRTNQSKSLLEKTWPTTDESSSLSYSAPPPMQVIPSSEATMSQLYLVGNEGRISQQGAIREPVIMMQRPQSMNVKQNPLTNVNVSLPGTTEWYSNNVSRLKSLNPDNNLMRNQSTGRFGTKNLSSHHFYPQAHINNSLGAENFSLQQGYPQTQYTQHTYMSNAVDPAAARLGSSWNTMGSSLPPITVPSSLGLFSGWGSTGMSGSSHVDWNARDMMSISDYNSIDWTLNSNSSSSNSDGLMLGLSSMRIASSKSIHMARLQECGMPTESMSSSGPPCEWTSPLTGKDIFSVPRQFVTSPSP